MLVAVAVAALAGGSAALSAAPRGPHVGKCPLFPRSSHWNKRVDGLPLHPRSRGDRGRDRPR